MSKKKVLGLWEEKHGFCIKCGRPAIEGTNYCRQCTGYNFRIVVGSGHPRFYEILDEMAKLHDAKNADYASSADPLANFKRVAEMCKKYKFVTEGNEPVKVALIYAMKQIDASFKLLGAGQKGKVEGFKERMMDIAVYSILAMILYEECGGE